MEEDVTSPLAASHLLQHTLRSICINPNTHTHTHWVYAVFWRILPRNFPPPKWDAQGGAYDRSRGNPRNWILAWEDGFCNFGTTTNAAWEDGFCNFGTTTNAEINPIDCSTPLPYINCDFQHLQQGLQPQLFFKMSHEIYNYGEGLIGKVAADHSHKWIHKDPGEQEINCLSTCHSLADSQPRTWEAQFQCGIKTIALIAVREGVIQLGAMQNVVEDLNYILSLRKKFSIIESISGVLLPHPSSSAFPYKAADGHCVPPETWPFQEYGYVDPFTQQQPPIMMKITPSMSSLEALISKLPPVVPPSPSEGPTEPHQLMSSQTRRPFELMGFPVEKEENQADDPQEKDMGEHSSSSHHQQHFYHHQDLNRACCRPDQGLLHRPN